MKKGFTLIELLAVIVILAIILVIAVPHILSIINNAKVGAFESDAKIVLGAISYKAFNDETFDLSTINETNIKSLAGIDASNYEKVTVAIENGIPYITIIGKNKWSGFVAMGNSNNVLIHKGLLLLFDAGLTKSYPGTGAALYDLSGNIADGTINGLVTWVSNGEKSYFNFPANNDGDNISTNKSQDYKDFFIVFEPDYSATYTSISMLFSNGGDKSLRFVSTVTPWTLGARNPGDVNDWAYPQATKYYINGVVTNNLPSSGWVTLSGYKTNTTTFSSPFVLRISGGFTARNFAGKIAFVAMYNRKLDESEVQKMHNYFKVRFGI